MLNRLKTPEGKKFLLVTVILFLIAITVISRATFEGVEQQYNLPMAQWSKGMFVMQGAWVLVYSIAATFITSLPFAFYFLGPKDDRD